MDFSVPAIFLHLHLVFLLCATAAPCEYVEEWKCIMADVTFVISGPCVGHHVLRHV